MDIVRTLATSVLFAIVLAQENLLQKKAGMLGHSVKLPCGLRVSKPPNVTWQDTVHTSEPWPIVIFQSLNTTNNGINSAHPNAGDYQVDRSKFDLKISSLTVDDVGAYTCISRRGGDEERQGHYLIIYGDFVCSGGEKRLREGESTNLTCEVMYSGEQPSLGWFRDDQELDSKDNSGFVDGGPLASKELVLNATDDLDGKRFICRMEIADRKAECNRVLNITYPVRDVTFGTGDDNTFYVGEEVTCTARGNPAPEISLVPTSLQDKVEDRGKSSIIIPSSWVGTEVDLICTARNIYEGEERVVQKSKKIHVLEPTTTTTTTTTTMKPKIEEPAKPAVDGGNNASGERLHASWKGFPLIALSTTLMKLLLVF